jgi:hypothetical protein
VVSMVLPLLHWSPVPLDDWLTIWGPSVNPA